MQRNYFFMVFLFALLLIFNLPASATDFSNCLKCHDTTQRPNVDVTKFNLAKVPDGSGTGSFVDKSRCAACHTNYLEPNHQGVKLALQTVNGVVYPEFPV